jgi:hypothetical protein
VSGPFDDRELHIRERSGERLDLVVRKPQLGEDSIRVAPRTHI